MNNLFTFLYSFLVSSFIGLGCGFLWNLAATDLDLPTISVSASLILFWLANVLVTWFTKLIKSAWTINVLTEAKKVSEPLDK